MRSSFDTSNAAELSRCHSHCRKPRAEIGPEADDRAEGQGAVHAFAGVGRLFAGIVFAMVDPRFTDIG